MFSFRFNIYVNLVLIKKDILRISKHLQILLFTCLFFSSLFGGGGQFTGWGDTILHHVADSNIVHVYGIPISKHVIMLLISAFVTLILSILATQKYRKYIYAKPGGLSQIFEILMYQYDLIKLLPVSHSYDFNKIDCMMRNLKIYQNKYNNNL